MLHNYCLITSKQGFYKVENIVQQLMQCLTFLWHKLRLCRIIWNWSLYGKGYTHITRISFSKCYTHMSCVNRDTQIPTAVSVCMNICIWSTTFYFGSFTYRNASNTKMVTHLKFPQNQPKATNNRRRMGLVAQRPLLWLPNWGRDKMAAISQTTFSNAFSWMKMYEFRLWFHWNLFLMFQLTIFQHWFR